MRVPHHLASIASIAAALASCGPQMALTSTVDARPEWETEARPVPVDLPRIVPIPDIPVALRGCWDSIPPSDPEEPGGPVRVVIDATTITQVAEGVGNRVATAEFVEKVTPTVIEGRFSAPDGNGRATVATSIQLGPDVRMDIPADTLWIAEGDAGSYLLARCRH